MTPNALDGICQPLKSCSLLFNILNNKPVLEKNLKLVRESLCKMGADGKPWVCCPPPSVDRKTATTTMKPVTTSMKSPGE